jgi:8-oxo-dGTP pyrophosphatase MutT (NUDIX family)
VTQIAFFSVRPGIRIRALPAVDPFAPNVERRVRTLWNAAARRPNARLVDGSLFSLTDPWLGESEEMTGRFTAYRYYLAQRLDPTLADTLRIRPLAVTAIVSCADGLVVGKRSTNATQDPGAWEFFPAGGLEPDCLRSDDSLDPATQVRKELREEIGIEVGEDLKLQPMWCMVENEVTDLVFRVMLSAGKAELAARFASLASSEHTAIDVVRLDHIGRRPEFGRGRFSPGSEALLERLMGAE